MSMRPDYVLRFYKRILLQFLIVTSFCSIYIGVQVAKQTVHDMKIAKIKSLQKASLNSKQSIN